MKDKDFERLCPEIEFGLNGHWKKTDAFTFSRRVCAEIIETSETLQATFYSTKE